MLKLTFNTVEKVFTYDHKAIYAVENEGGEKVHCTANHPFYVVNKGKFIRADRLEKTDRIFELKDNKLANKLKVSATQKSEKVYDLTVKDSHTFFVGKSGVWVHNSNYEMDVKNNLVVACGGRPCITNDHPVKYFDSVDSNPMMKATFTGDADSIGFGARKYRFILYEHFPEKPNIQKTYELLGDQGVVIIMGKLHVSRDWEHTGFKVLRSEFRPNSRDDLVGVQAVAKGDVTEANIREFLDPIAYQIYKKRIIDSDESLNLTCKSIFYALCREYIFTHLKFS
ncbi:polymorphic toxin-type HINT domain-containing protein [Fangia hongkongensis]|uniref:polymorphic toxin-type HINT domain-containing protein n=1 Tax=Fangia hongkongensis TaxID=270495 RepID=UPI0003A6F4B6|nr:polymorphic toxin-type HINT domain-containing protein [Fangia hongkongensis]MBK2125146.1 hypothetical protein [Fangia hongkongensis]